MCRPVLSGTVEMIKLQFDVIGVEGLMEREEEGMMLCRVPEEETVRGALQTEAQRGEDCFH